MTMIDEVARIDCALHELIFSDELLMVMVRRRLGIFTSKGVERGFWSMIGRVSDMGPGLDWLMQRAKGGQLTHVDVSRCFSVMRVAVVWVRYGILALHATDPHYKTLCAALDAYDATKYAILRREYVIDNETNARVVETSVHNVARSHADVLSTRTALMDGTDPHAALARTDNAVAAALLYFLREKAPKTLGYGSAADQTCRVCGKAAEQQCSVCDTARYCTATCQQKDWPLHRRECKTAAIVGVILDAA